MLSRRGRALAPLACRQVPSVASVGNDTWKTPASSERVTRKPLSAKTQHPVVLAEHVGLELGDAVGRAMVAEVLEQYRADATALVRVSDRERDLGAARASSRGTAYRATPMMRSSSPCRASRPRAAARKSSSVNSRSSWSLSRRLARKEAEVDRFRTELLEAARELVTVRGPDGAQVDRRAIAKDDVGGVVPPLVGHRTPES